MKKNHIFSHLLKLKDIDQMFDMIIAGVYFAGSLQRPIPVDEAREVFQAIKRLSGISKGD
jgi:hypothetical protein